MTAQKRIAALAGSLLSVLALTAGPIAAQDISTYYTVMHPDEFEIDWQAHYRTFERLTQEVRERLPHELDIAYGEDPKQHLDLYFPPAKSSPAPVLVFLHGGGNREGDRRQYGYVSRPFAAEGVITVVASYRLQPAHPWPAQREDAQAVLEWVHNNIEARGGDLERIFLAGHSAGSRLTAELSYSDDWLSERSLPRNLIKGAALISGLSSLPVAEEMPDAALRSENGVLQHIPNAPPRNVIAVGELEADGGRDGRRLENSRNVAELLRASGADVDFLVPAGHDHATLVFSLAQEDSELFKAVRGMMTD